MSTSIANNVFIGVDIGGSHITAAQINPDDWSILPHTRVRCKVDAHADANTVISQWTSALANLCTSTIKENIRIGIAMPGPFDYSKGISLIKGMNKYDNLYGLDVRQLLADSLDISPNNITFRNDAEAFLHGEVMFARFPVELKVIGITLGTGLGSAVSQHGYTTDVFRAIHAMHTGIAEDYISTRWFKKRCAELSGLTQIDVEALILHDDTLLKETVFREFGANLALFLTKFADEEQADVVVIGGNIAKSMQLFISQAAELLIAKNVQIRQSQLWESAALVGAACSWPVLLQQDKNTVVLTADNTSNISA